MELAARIGAWSGNPLPYLRRVAYLESHGTEWIDTGKRLTNEDEVILSFSLLNNSGALTHGLFGSRSSANFRNFSASYNITYGVDSDLNSSNYQTYRATANVSSWDSDVRIETSKFSRKITINGILSQNQTACNDVFETPSNCLLLKINGSTFDNAIIKLRGFEIAGKMMLIPVLDLSGRPAMYNEAQSDVPADDPSRFLYNASGVGEFTTDLDVQT